MPCLKIFTNVSKSAVPKSFVTNIIPVLSKCMNKPVDRFLVSVSAECQVCAGGSQAAGVVASLESIGGLGPRENNLIAGVLTDYIAEQLGVDKNRIFISFYDIAAYNIALNGVTIG